MADFPVFISSLLFAVADFMWMDGTKYITCVIVLLGLVTACKRLIKL